MSVEDHLIARAADAVLGVTEVGNINTSITALQSRVDAYFPAQGYRLYSHFRFGSSTRGTILPRRLDENSDIDYMIVFNDGGYRPQTYLDRIRRFVEARYSRSEINQENPTIVLELNHIKFELVPALHYWGTTYKIPDGPDNWQETSPQDFNQTLENLDSRELRKIRTTVRLVKIWNVNQGFVFNSYLLEKWICSLSFFGCYSQTDYVFKVFDSLSPNQATQWRNDRINRAKDLVTITRQNLAGGYPYTAEQEIKKLIP